MPDTHGTQPKPSPGAGAQSVPDRLAALGALFEKRNSFYRSSWHEAGDVLKAIFPRGISLKTSEDFGRFAIVHLLVGKLHRYALMFDRGGHADSLDDLAVYSQMLRELDETIITESRMTDTHYEHGSDPVSRAEVSLKDRILNDDGFQKRVIDAGNLIAAVCHILSCEGGWWNEDVRSNPLIVPTKLALTHSELSEAMEGHRTNAADQHLQHRKSLDVELTDAVIRIGDLCGFLDIPLGNVLLEKLAFNQRRADHKPEARASQGGKKY